MLCTEELVQKVWEKGVIDPRTDSRHWRKDQCGAWISRSDYGCQRSSYGWEINYIRPQSEKDSEKISNLRPMQWNNDLGKHHGSSVCVLKAVGANNCQVSLTAIQ
jgi:hypothetical protein